MRNLHWTIAGATLLGWAAAAAAQSASPAGRLTIDKLVAIKHPTSHQWTADGQYAVFNWDDGGVVNTYTVAADGTSAPVALTTGGQALGGGFWSKDTHAYYFQRGGGLQMLPVTGGAPQPAWPSAAGASEFTLSPDGGKVAYVIGAGGGRGGRGGRGVRGAQPAQGTAPAATAAGEGATLVVHDLASGDDHAWAHEATAIRNVVWSPDGLRLAYLRAATGTDAPAAIMEITLTSGSATLVAEAPAGAASLAWTPDASRFILSAGGGGRGAGPIHHDVSPPEIGNKLIFVITEGGRGGTPATTYSVAASGGTPAPVAMPAGGGFGGRGGGNWIDATHVLSTHGSSDGRTRTTEAIDVDTGAATVLHTDTEDKFFSQVNTTTALSPDRHWLMYTSDATGWDQIYVVSTAGGTPVQITQTPGEHWRAVWSHDSSKLAWDTNSAARPGDRQIEVATLGKDGKPAGAKITAITSGDGTNIAPQWSPDDSRILYQHTDARNSADLFAVAARADATPVRLTNSMPASIDKSLLVAPQLVHYPGPDGKPVPAWLFVPHNLDRSHQHAAIVWIHPDGVNMNYDGWHTDRNEAVYYEFHQYLLQQGYVVIAPDYRGSIGYGRDWRNDVYMDVGGNDAKDARMAATYLKSLGYVDANRIGVWGLSYGGFFTLLAVTQEPTWFRAAVDVAGVTDYHLYYEDPYHGTWTTSRIGTPEEHPDVYNRADPMAHVDQIQHPLLVLAGTADVNVPFMESALLIDALLKAGKGDLTTFMMYPGEFHYFDRSFVVRDAWQRVDQFFAANLHPGQTGIARR